MGSAGAASTRRDRFLADVLRAVVGLLAADPCVRVAWAGLRADFLRETFRALFFRAALRAVFLRPAFLRAVLRFDPPPDLLRLLFLAAIASPSDLFGERLAARFEG